MTAGDGKACKRCGTTEWYRGGQCVACTRENNRQWHAANQDKARRASRHWYTENKDKHMDSGRRYNAVNRKRVNRASRQWATANPDKKRDADRRWKKANPDKVNAHSNLRRTRITEAGGSYTVAEWKSLCKQYGGRCACCGKKRKLEFDHVIPVSKGGSSDISNGQPLCRSCNARKGDKTTDYRTKPGFLRWIQRKLF